MDNNKLFHKLVKIADLHKGISRNEIYTLIGVSGNYFAKMFRGAENVNQKTLDKLAELVGVELEISIKGEDVTLNDEEKMFKKQFKSCPHCAEELNQ